MPAEARPEDGRNDDVQVRRGLNVALQLPGVVVVLLDGGERITYWNHAAARLSGWSSDEALGREFSSMLTETEAGTWRKLMGKLRRGRQLPPLQTHLHSADATEVDVLLSAAAVTDEDGYVTGYALGMQDVTPVNREIARAQRSSAEVQSIVQTVLDGIIGISTGGIIEAFNSAAEQLFGYRAHEVIGCNVSMLMPEPYRSQHDEYLARYLQTGRARIIGIGREVVAQRKDGSRFPADLSVSELKVTGQARSFVGVVRDITERKETEARLKAMNVAMAEKVDELNETLTRLQETQKQLVQSEKMASLGALVAGVAHEINTPIGVCVSASSMLEASAKEINEKLESSSLTRSEFQHFISNANQATDLINRNIKRAADLVSAFKQTAVDRSQDAAREIELDAYLHDVVLSVSPMWRGKGHHVDVECPRALRIYTDAGALAQIVTNLISNATMHAFASGIKGEIHIVANAENGKVELSISDNGCGIPQSNLGKIFDPFFTTARNQGGTGLGLHISYNLITQALQGSIDVESAEGRGTKFVMRFPQRLDKDKSGAKDAHETPRPTDTPTTE